MRSAITAVAFLSPRAISVYVWQKVEFNAAEIFDVA